MGCFLSMFSCAYWLMTNSGICAPFGHNAFLKELTSLLNYLPAELSVFHRIFMKFFMKNTLTAQKPFI